VENEADETTKALKAEDKDTEHIDVIITPER
jgi:hypothetical protein